MKKYTILYIIISFIFVFCGSSDDKSNGLLWKISGNGLEKPSYLFGTTHGDNYGSFISFLDSIPYLHENILNVRQFIGEKNHFKDEKINLNSLQMDSAYSNFISKMDVTFLDSILLKYMGKTSDQINFKPMVLIQMIRNKMSLEIKKEFFFERIKSKGYIDDYDWNEMNNMKEETMDFYLQKKAKIAGCNIIGLDDEIGFNLDNLVDSVSLYQQITDMITLLKSNMMEKAIKENLKNPYSDSLKIAYYNQNLDKIERYSSFLLYSDTSKFSTKLLIERNFKWMNYIPQLIQKQPSFIAVGVRHLPGEEGLIKLLRKKGYKVEPVQ